MGGSKSGSAGAGTVDYFGTVGAVLAVGQTDALLAIVLEEVLIWEPEDGDPNKGTPGYLGTDANGATQLTIDGRGEIRIYWGTETQQPDPFLNDNEFGEVHPAYLGVTYVVLVDFLLGQERSEPPSALRFVLRRGARLASGAVHPLDSDGQANPAAILEETLTGFRTGLDLPASMLDTASWDAARAGAAASSGRTYLSPLLTEQDAVRGFAANIAQVSGVNAVAVGTKVGATYRPNQGSPVVVLADQQFAGRPRWQETSWADLPNRLTVAFTDGTRRYKRNAVRISNPLNPGVGDRTETFDFENLVAREAQAVAWAQLYVTRRGVPFLAGEVQVRRGHAGLLVPGAFFRLDTDIVPGGAQRQTLARVQSVARPSGNAPVRVRFTEEPDLPPLLIPAGTSPVLPLRLPEPFKFTRLIETPPNFDDFRVRRVSILAMREDNTTLGAGLYVRQPGKEAVPLGWVRQVTLLGRLVGPLDASTITFAVKMVRPWAQAQNDEALLLGTSPGAQAAVNNDLLAILIETTADGTQVAVDSVTGFAKIELCSVEVTDDLGHGDGFSTWSLTVFRQRLGWPARAFPAGALSEVWIVARESLPALQNRLLTIPVDPPLARFGELPGPAGPISIPTDEPPAPTPRADLDPIEWRAVPFNAFVAYPLEVSPEEPIPEPGPPWRLFDFGAQGYAPLITWFPASTPDGASIGGPPFSVTWQVRVTDADGNLARVQVRGIVEGKSIQILQDIDLASTADFTTEEPQSWKLPEDTVTDRARLEVRATDTRQNVVVASRNYITSTTGTTIATPPLISPAEQFFANYVQISIRPVNSQSTVWFRITLPDGSEPVPWNPHLPGATLTFTASRSQTIWAYAREAGLTDSPIVYRSYYQGTGGGRIEPPG